MPAYREGIYFISLSAQAENFTTTEGHYFTSERVSGWKYVRIFRFYQRPYVRIITPGEVIARYLHQIDKGSVLIHSIPVRFSSPPEPSAPNPPVLKSGHGGNIAAPNGAWRAN